MLYETKEINPTIVTEKNALIKAMKNNDKVIYIKGSLYNDMKNKVIGSKTLKATKGLGKFGLGLSAVTALLGGPVGWAAFAAGLSVIGLSKYQDDFDNYTPRDNTSKQQIELYKSKGKNKIDKKTDNIKSVSVHAQNLQSTQNQQVSSQSEKTWDCNCGQKGVAGNFCNNGGSKKAEDNNTLKKKFYTVELLEAGTNRVETMKVVRSVMSLSLNEVREKVDRVPSVIAVCNSMVEAEEIKAKLEAIGAFITIS